MAPPYTGGQWRLDTVAEAVTKRKGSEMVRRGQKRVITARRGKGFTLVELIVVIAIIAILAGILVPVTANVLEKSRVSKGLAEGRGFSTALDKLNADVGYYPPEAAVNTDPGLVEMPRSITVKLARQWSGPYVKVWPTNNPWGGQWDYDYNNSKTLSFDHDGLAGNEIVISHVKGSQAAAMPMSAADAIDLAMNNGDGRSVGQFQWTTDGSGKVDRAATYMAEGPTWIGLGPPLGGGALEVSALSGEVAK